MSAKVAGRSQRPSQRQNAVLSVLVMLREILMRVRYALITGLFLLAAAPAAQAQEGAAAGAVTGAVAGALIGGPVGAVVGGIAGAAAGGTAQELTRPRRGTVTVRPAHADPVRVKTCVRDVTGRETCTTSYR